MKIWVDADGCPNAVKEIVFRAASKRSVEAVLVANRILYTPQSNYISSIVVSQGLDVADDWIAERVEEDDLVITADIPLAARVVERGATGINPRGETYTEENVRERLSVRDFMAELREQGVQTGGAPPFGNKDKQSFANALDRILTRKGL
ncbi:MAG: YaiI/YqxD family protein [Myxococcota bacterium]